MRTMILFKRSFVGFVAFTFLLAVLDVPLSMAQQAQAPPPDYRVGPGDRIFVSVAQRPDLNREFVIGPEGTVTIPLIGDVNVNGQTAQQMQVTLLQALRDYYPSINRVDVTVTQAVSQVIYVTGEVRLPGKYNFSGAMNLWEAIREAGGPLQSANLDSVRIVKDRSRGGTSRVVNVLSAIEGGSVDSLPDLEPGDTIIIPAQQDVYTGAFGVNVFGSVVRPGVYRLQNRQDLVSAVLLAGGPNDRAELGGVRIIRPRKDGTTITVSVDMNDFLRHGDPYANPTLKPGDTIHIPRKGRLSQLASSDLQTWIQLVTATATVTLLFITVQDRLDQNN